MRQLIKLSNSQDAAELVRRLNDASLHAVHTEVPPLDGEAMSRSLVWIAEDDDMMVAKRVIEAFRADAQVSRGGNCAVCGYLLRGHAGKGRCPECGHPFERNEVRRTNQEQRDIACPACGEEVPDHFENCWNCGNAMSKSSE